MTAVSTEVSTTSFDTLALAAPILEAIKAAGYTEPTAVQARAVPEALNGRDLLVSSQTGSGKTAAFMLPALQLLTKQHERHGKGPRILVLTPTRELAVQVTKAADTYGRTLRVKTLSVVGGMPYPLQNRMLKNGVDILVATPGRLLDQLNSGRIDLSRLQMLVLDEADRMLDMGFKDELEAIVAKVPKARQTLFFSATLEPGIVRLAGAMLKDPLRIAVDTAQTRHENISQRLHFADDMGHKNRMLENILNNADMQQAIVFTSTKRAADQLAQTLHALGLSAAAMHGDMNQGARNRTLQALRRGSLKVLVATDVAARGIDVQGISHVINYDLPTQAEDYVHRIGRTGRAGRNGVAISFANVRDHHMVRSIERFTTQKIEVTAIVGLEPKMRAFSKPAPRNTRPGGGKTFSRPNAAPGGRREGFGGYAKRDGRPAGRSPARTSPYK
jgi:superfamily II DNA/RNA helicase